MAEHHRLSKQDFISKAQKVHGLKYNYTSTVYVKQHKDVTIICPQHGPFQIRPINHIHGKQGCPLCGSGKKRTTEDFIILAKEVHGDRYDYSKVKYKNAISKVKIICKEHGMFLQTPDMHCYSNHQGCPRCKASKGERIIYKILKELKVTDFICEKTFKNCKNPKTKLFLSFDFYIPSKKLLIEYDGQQHFKPVNFSGKLSKQKQMLRLKTTQYLDNIKDQYARKHNFKLLRISYWEYNNIKEILLKNI